MMMLAAQLTRPEVAWTGMWPLILLVVPGMVLLHLSALMRRSFRGFFATFTVLTASLAAVFAIPLWNRVVDPDRGAFTTLADAYIIDGFSVFFTVLISLAVVITALLIHGWQEREGQVGAEMYVLVLLSAAGGVIMASALDLIVMFLGLEVLSIAVYVLAAMNLRRTQSQEAGLKYLVLGAFSSVFFLYGIAMVYGATGTTNLAGIAAFLGDGTLDATGLLFGGFGFLLVGFAFKVAAVPFHVWTPDVYQGAPTPVVAFMASAVKAAGFAGLLRVFAGSFGAYDVDWQPVVYALAVLSLAGGSVLAVVQTDVKRMMAYSSIAHAGFILVGVQAATGVGIRAALFYLAAYTFMVAGTFGVITVVGRSGDGHHHLADYQGLGSTRPALAFVFALLLFAQAGVPLTSGFFAKFYVISAAIDARSFWLAIAAMVAAVISAFIYLRIIVAMYMSDAHGEAEEPAGPAVLASDPIPVPAATWAAVLVSLAITLVVGFAPATLSSLAADAEPGLSTVCTSGADLSDC